jgi:hypothetical protein
VNRVVRCGLVCLVAAALLGSAGTAGASPSGSGLDRLRSATVTYFDIDHAKADGYGELKDANGIACIDSDDGGMGIHYVHSDLVGDSQVKLRKPEALIYEPRPDGYMELVAVEYVVFRSAWRQAHPTGRPKLLGQRFSLVEEGNRYGLPAFFELHVWAWRHNPNGMFTDYNPRVTCKFAPAS